MANTAVKNKDRNTSLDNLVGSTDAKIDAQARERIVTSRIGLLLKHSFFGNLATRLQLVNADEWLPTAAVDGIRFYYNSRFVMKLKPKEVDFLVAHEILHLVYDHLDRRQNRDPQMYNIACDYAVNADLKRQRIGQFITTVPCLYEPKYDGKASEEIYDDLMKNVQKLDLDQLLDQMIDQHLDGDDGDGDGDETDGEGKPKKGPAKMSDAEREQARQEMKQAIISAAQSAEAGSLPRGVERMIKDLTSPVMPWRDLIQVNLTSAIRNDYSWMRPSRRGWHMDAVMPGMTPGEEIDVAVAIDMSGSISDKQAKAFLSEVVGMIESFDGFKLHIFCFDTNVYNAQDFSSDNLDSVETYEPKGGGGTDFTAIYTHLKDNDNVPKRLIVFTDGLPYGSWGDPDYCDVTWIIHGSKDITPPFGQWAYFDDK
jgi:predicted metal-dependent peptidase